MKKEKYINDVVTWFIKEKEKALLQLDESPFEIVRTLVKWGSYGKSGKESLHYIKLCDMSDEHLRNVIVTQIKMNEIIKSFMVKELKYRKEKRIKI